MLRKQPSNKDMLIKYYKNNINLGMIERNNLCELRAVIN